MSNTPICPCGGLQVPPTISNTPGRDRISYRVGDYISFREALLRPRLGETELTKNWRPGASGDLAVQMVEWWAYLADILTFYNEVIANEDYLRTADLPESVKRLILLLGYRPRPGIGATGTLAALLSSPKPITLPQGFQVQSKPGPGKQPQIFELGTATLAQQPDSISADPVPGGWVGSNSSSVLLQGVVSGIKVGDELLLLERNWKGQDQNYAIVTANNVAPVKDPRGKTNTQVTFNESFSYLAGGQVQNYRLLQSPQSAHVWQYPATTVAVINPGKIDLESITREIAVGDPVLLEIGGAAATRGIYFTPDGHNLSGGGNSTYLGVLNRCVTQMIAYQSGLITAFDDGTIFYSPDGKNLGGGGNTAVVYSGSQQVTAMSAYNGGAGVLIAFNDGSVYSSPDSSTLGSGGVVTQYPAPVSTLVAFQSGVIVSFNDGNGAVFYSPDGANLYGGGQTQSLGQGFSGAPPQAMVVYGNNLITVWPDDTFLGLYLSDGLNLMNQTVFVGFAFIQVITYGSAGVITAIYDLITGVSTVYYSSDGQNLASAAGNTSKVYSGPNYVTTMLAFSTGVLTAFNDGTIYYSPDGTNLKGGGKTIQVFGPAPLPLVLLSCPDLAFGAGVIAAFQIPRLLSVNSYQELVWYANPAGPAFDPTQPPPAPTPPIPILHTEIGFRPALPPTITGSQVEPGERPLALLRHGWRDVGTLIAFPSTALTSTLSLLAPLPAALLPMSGQNVLISDQNGNGVEASAGTSDPSSLTLSNISGSPASLLAPFNVFFDLLSVSRGKTVSNEVLGSGDATVAGQQFVLQNSPLTYLMSSSSTSGAGYTSTLKVWVDGVQWQEAPSFYAQPPDAHIFVTREDENNQTHVQFGDGINGARLSSGTNNVVATYRYGSGADSPNAGSLTMILQPQPGLKSIVNPVPVGGGADPDPPDQIRKYAPQSVLNFGRAVSGKDYETIAAQTPGVARAKAYWSWDPQQQRTVVTVYVGDDQNAVDSAKLALSNADDPNRPVVVNLAMAVPASLSLTLLVDPSYLPADVKTAVTAALIDPDHGLLGARVIGIGQVIFESQIYEACLGVPGAVAMHALSFSTFATLILFRQLGRLTNLLPAFNFLSQPQAAPFRFDPGTGGFFQLPSSSLTISTEVASNG